MFIIHRTNRFWSRVLPKRNVRITGFFHSSLYTNTERKSLSTLGCIGKVWLYLLREVGMRLARWQTRVQLRASRGRLAGLASRRRVQPTFPLVRSSERLGRPRRARQVSSPTWNSDSMDEFPNDFLPAPDDKLHCRTEHLCQLCGLCLGCQI